MILRSCSILSIAHYSAQLEKDREGSVVGETHLHMRPELTLLDLQPVPPQGRSNIVHQLVRLLWWRGGREAGPTAAAQVRVQGELADQQHVTADVEDRQIGLTVRVLETAQQ